MVCAVPNGNACVGEVGVGEAAEQRAGVRPHHAEHGERLGDVHQLGVLVRADVPADPVPVAHGLGRAADEVVLVGGQADRGQVALEAAAVVQQAGVHRLADRHVHVVGAEPLEHADRVAPSEEELREAGLVEDRHLLARGPMFGGVKVEPVLPAEGVRRHRLGPVAGEPVGPLPAALAAEAGAPCRQPVVQRALAQAAAGGELAVGPGHLVVQAEDLGGALAQEGAVVGVRPEPADIHGPQVHRRLALGHPLGQVLARAAGAGDAEGVEPGRHEQAAQLRRLAQEEVVVRGEALRAVDELGELGLLQRGNAPAAGPQRLGEPFPVGFE